MADFYKILKADPMGDPYTPNAPGAKPIQSYWCQVENQDWAVMVGKQVGNALTPGMHIYGDLTYAKSQKGTEYWKFKSQQVPDDVQRPADSPAQATAQQATGQAPNASDTIPGWAITLVNMVEYIYKEMAKMSETPPPKELEHLEQPAEQPNLDDIFTPDTEVPEDVPEDK